MSAAAAYQLEQDDEALATAPVDLLTQLFNEIRPELADTTRPPNTRLLLFWSYAKHAQDLGARDVVVDEFMRLAIEVDSSRQSASGCPLIFARTFGGMVAKICAHS